MSPDSRFTASCNSVRLFPTTNDGDSIPVSLLLARASCCRVGCVCRDVGIVPVRKLFDTSTLIKEETFPMSASEPCRPLPEKCNVCNSGMVHTHSGILPCNVATANRPLKPGTRLWQLIPEESPSSTGVCKLLDKHISAGREPCMQLLYRRIVCSCVLKSRGDTEPDKAFCDRSKATPAPTSLSEIDRLDPIFPSTAGIGPVRELLLILMYKHFSKNPSEEGMVPPRELLLRLSSVSSLSWPSEDGMGPVSKFSSKDSPVSAVRSPSEDGMGPDSKFLIKSSSVSAVRSPSEDGIGPVSEFASKTSSVSFIRLASEDGIDPVSEFSSKASCMSDLRSPSEDGMGPVSEFSSKGSSVSAVRSPSDDGMDPVS